MDKELKITISVVDVDKFSNFILEMSTIASESILLGIAMNDSENQPPQFSAQEAHRQFQELDKRFVSAVKNFAVKESKETK